MDRQKFIDTIRGMKNGEYYTHEGRNKVTYMFHKDALGTYSVWAMVNGFNVSNTHFDRFTSDGGAVIGMVLGNEFVGCLPVYQLGVE